MSTTMTCSSWKAESRTHSGERSRENAMGRVVLGQDPGFREPFRAPRREDTLTPGPRWWLGGRWVWKADGKRERYCCIIL